MISTKAGFRRALLLVLLSPPSTPQTNIPGTTCGELPFFSETPRTATVVAEKATVAWIMDSVAWRKLQKENQAAAEELLRISLK